MEYHAGRDRKRGVRAGAAPCRRRWRGGLAAIASVLALAAAGCASSSSPRSSATASSTGGLVSPSSTSTASPAVPGEAMATGQQSGIVGGTLFGGDVPLTAEAAKLDRTLAIVRTYYTFGEQFPTPQDKKLMQAGSTMVVSLDDVPARGVSYASIIDGQHDALIKSFLEQVEQAAVTYHLGAIYFTFEHEANAPRHLRLGTPAQFIQAWDHVHALAASAHLNWNDGGRIHWVLILTQEAYQPMASRPKWADKAGVATSFFPGRSEVDIVAADGYNSGSCRNANQGSSANYVDSGTQLATPQELFGPMVAFAHDQGGMAAFVTEWGSVPYSSPAEQPDFIREMQDFVTANREVVATMYWDSSPPGFSCNYTVNNQPAALAALAAMGHAPALQGRA